MFEVLEAGLPSPARGIFTTRPGGTSLPPYAATNLSLHTGDEWDRVHATRDLLARQLGLGSFAALVFGRQVHGNGVRYVDRASSRASDRGVRATDGLVTTTPGLALVVLGADCLPVLLVDPTARVIGAAHVGRQGLVLGVLLQVLAEMAERGAQPTRIHASIGPGICGACYELPEQLAHDVVAAAPGSGCRTLSGKPAVDLTAGARRQLREAGVGPITAVGGCTFEQPEHFFSYRRDGVTGRHAGVVWLS